MSEPTLYRNYVIEPCTEPWAKKLWNAAFSYRHVAYDGPGDRRFGYAKTIEEAREEIDEYEDEREGQK